MRTPRNSGPLGVAFSALFAAWAVIACAHDFEAYEPGAGATATDAAQSDGAVEGSTTPPGNDGATPPVDGSMPPIDAGPACASKAACGTTQSSCTNACDQTRGTCISGCGGGQPGAKCKMDCNNAQTTCTAACKSTCSSCAGAACAAVCP